MRLFAVFAIVLACVATLRIGYGRSLSGVVQAIRALPCYWEDRSPQLADEKSAQLKAIAEAIERHGRTRTEKATTIAHIYGETRFSLRITDGQCRRWECDKGKARGLGQLHRNGLPDTEWDRMHGLGNIDAQIYETTLRIRRALAMCGNAEGALRSMTGRGCKAELGTIGERMKTFNLALRRM